MAAKEIDLSRLSIEPVTLADRDAAIEESVRAGFITAQCAQLVLTRNLTLGEKQVSINPFDQNDSVKLWFNEYVPYKDEDDVQGRIVPVTGLVQGLQYDGVLRKPKPVSRRRHFDVPPEDIAVGDRVQLRAPCGKLVLVEKVREILQPETAAAHSSAHAELALQTS